MKKYLSIILLLISVPNILLSQSISDKKITKIVAKYKHGLCIKQDTSYNKFPFYVPTTYKIQTGGNLGYVALGFSYELSKTYDISFMMGYFHEKIEQGKVVTTSLKNNFKIYRFNIFKNIYLTPIAGLNINWGHTHNTFRILPSHYPDDYYFQNLIHINPYIGYIVSLNIKSPTVSSIEFYSEISSLDNYLLECIRTKYVKLNDIINVSLGINIKMRNYFYKNN